MAPRTGIGLARLVAAIALLISASIQAANMAQPLPAITVLNANTELAILGDKATLNSAGTDLTPSFGPPDTLVRERVLQNLREFRAAYQQLSPALKVYATPGNSSGEKVALELGTMLAVTELGRAMSSPSTQRLPGPATGVWPAIVVDCARGDRPVLYSWLAALSPYLNGAVLIRFDDNRPAHDLVMYIRGTPEFTSSGVAIFPTSSATEP